MISGKQFVLEIAITIILVKTRKLENTTAAKKRELVTAGQAAAVND